MLTPMLARRSEARRSDRLASFFNNCITIQLTYLVLDKIIQVHEHKYNYFIYFYALVIILHMMFVLYLPNV